MSFPAVPGQRPGRGPGAEAPGSSEDTSFYSTKMGLKLMHFCRRIVVEIIRIGRQKISQKITFIFYTNEGVRILNWWISWLLLRNFCVKTFWNIFMTGCSTPQRSTKFIFILSGRLDKNVNAVLACPADSFGTLVSLWNFLDIYTFGSGQSEEQKLVRFYGIMYIKGTTDNIQPPVQQLPTFSLI